MLVAVDDEYHPGESEHEHRDPPVGGDIPVGCRGSPPGEWGQKDVFSTLGPPLSSVCQEMESSTGAQLEAVKIGQECADHRDCHPRTIQPVAMRTTNE